MPGLNFNKKKVSKSKKTSFTKKLKKENTVDAAIEDDANDALNNKESSVEELSTLSILSGINEPLPDKDDDPYLVWVFQHASTESLDPIVESVNDISNDPVKKTIDSVLSAYTSGDSMSVESDVTHDAMDAFPKDVEVEIF